jgi:hypothetical protein
VNTTPGLIPIPRVVLRTWLTLPAETRNAEIETYLSTELPNPPQMSVHDRVEFALLDAGFDNDTARALAKKTTNTKKAKK